MEDQHIQVLIVDDHPVVRRGLKSLLAEVGNIEVAGEAVNGVEAIVQYEAVQPDVVLMDLVMPEMNGIEAIQRITSAHPGSAHPGDDQLCRR